jgi:hypothetical protein
MVNAGLLNNFNTARISFSFRISDPTPSELKILRHPFTPGLPNFTQGFETNRLQRFIDWTNHRLRKFPLRGHFHRGIAYLLELFRNGFVSLTFSARKYSFPPSFQGQLKHSLVLTSVLRSSASRLHLEACADYAK